MTAFEKFGLSKIVVPGFSAKAYLITVSVRMMKFLQNGVTNTEILEKPYGVLLNYSGHFGFLFRNKKKKAEVTLCIRGY